MAGYTKLASFMADEQYEILKLFRSTALRDLLFLQAELIQLEEEYAAIGEVDRNTDGENRLYDRNWRLLSTSESRNFGGHQWQKALEIRAKLREYCLVTLGL
jgi:hypothetical protein